MNHNLICTINLYNICKAARADGIKVLIGGTAGDDIFSGYRRHKSIKLHNLIDKIPVLFREIIKIVFSKIKVYNSLIRRIKKIVSNINLKKDERLHGLYSWIDKERLKKLFINAVSYTQSDAADEQLYV